nr:hypothetical protein [Streptomyces sp. XY332]
MEGDKRHDRALLFVKMGAQLAVMPVQRLGQLVTVLGQSLRLPPVHEHLDLADPVGELPVLRLHRQDLLGIQVQVGHQYRPEHFVLPGVVGVQADRVEPPVLGEDPGPRGVGGLNVLDEFGQQARLATEHLVDHRHLAGVGVKGGV